MVRELPRASGGTVRNFPPHLPEEDWTHRDKLRGHQRDRPTSNEDRKKASGRGWKWKWRPVDVAGSGDGGDVRMTNVGRWKAVSRGGERPKTHLIRGERPN